MKKILLIWIVGIAIAFSFLEPIKGAGMTAVVGIDPYMNARGQRYMFYVPHIQKSIPPPNNFYFSVNNF